MLGVNVGCGATATQGWLNFDNSPTVRLARTPLVRFLSLGQRSFARSVVDQGVRWARATHLPLANGSMDAVYSSHMLEHMSRAQGAAFIAEARRVLKHGGVLRIAVPDLRVAIDEYLATGDANHFMDRSLLSNPLDTWRQRFSALFLGTRHHQWLYDGPSLAKAMTEAGFRDVRVLAAGETTIPNPGPLDLREREEESVYVEGVA